MKLLSSDIIYISYRIINRLQFDCILWGENGDFIPNNIATTLCSKHLSLDDNCGWASLISNRLRHQATVTAGGALWVSQHLWREIYMSTFWVRDLHLDCFMGFWGERNLVAEPNRSSSLTWGTRMDGWPFGWRACIRTWEISYFPQHSSVSAQMTY